MARKIAVPNIEELEKETPLSDITHQLDQKIPSISVYGCGGCGINIVKKLLEKQPTFDIDIKYSVIDTSLANTSQLPKICTVHSIGELGSGKDRSKNLQAIMKYLDNRKSLVTEASDITFLVFSMAGGSGSVIAPLFAHRLLRHSNRAVVLVGVVDSSSKRDCLNSILTLKSLSKLAEENNYYLPLMLYSNMEVGRVQVNNSIVVRLIEMLDLLTNKSITELDYTDKMLYLRPSVGSAPNGIYLLLVSETEPDKSQDLPGEMSLFLDEGDYVHAALIVNDTGCCPRVLTNITYVGISDHKKFYSTIGAVIPAEIINELNETAERYKRNEKPTDQTEKHFEAFGQDGASGLVF